MESNSSYLATSSLFAANAPEGFSWVMRVCCVPVGIGVSQCLRASTMSAAQPATGRFQVWASSRPSAK